MPTFVRRYADLKRAGVEALSPFAADVRTGRFPTTDESYHLNPAEAAALAPGVDLSAPDADADAGGYA